MLNTIIFSRRMSGANEFLRRFWIYGPARRNATRMMGCVCLLVLLASSAGCTRQMRISRHLRRGDEYFEKQRFHEASLEYLNVVRLDPNRAKVLERLGAIFYRSGQLRKAYAFWHRAETLDTNNVETGIRVAALSRFLGDPENARREALGALAKAPANQEALLIVAQCSYKPEQISEAEKNFDRCRKLVGESFQVHLASAILGANAGDQKRVQNELIKLQGLSCNSSQAWLALGGLAWRQNDLARAKEAFARAAQLSPDDGPVQVQVADFEIRTGQIEQGKKRLADIQKNAPDLTAATLMSAKMLVAGGKYDEALGLVDGVLNKNRDDAEAALLRAQILLTQGKATNAIPDLERLRDKFPRVGVVQYQLARAYVAGGQTANALASARQAVQLDPSSSEAVLLSAELDVRTRSFDSATASLTNLLARLPKLEQGWALLEEAYRLQDRSQDAIAACQRWQELAPKSADPVYLMGLSLRREGKTNEARASFEQALALAPGYAPALEQLIDMHLAEKRYDAAAGLVQAQIDKYPKAAVLWLLRAKVGIARGELGQAESDLRKALELDPQYDPAQLALADLYARSKRRDQALALFQSFLKRRPNNAAVWLQTALLQNEQGDYAKARESYEQVLKWQPNSVLALNNLAYLCVDKLNDLEAAYRFAQKAHDLAPDNASVADTLGWILCQRHEYAVALPFLEAAAVKLGAQPDIQNHLATAQYMLDDEPAARPLFQILCQPDKEFAGKSKAQQHLWTLNHDPQNAAAADVEKLKGLVKQDPEDVIAHLRLGAVLQKQNLLDEALEQYRAAVTASPKSVPLRLQLANFYGAALRDFTKALEEAKAAREMAPDNPEVAQAVGRLTYKAGQARRAYYILSETARLRPNDPTVQFDFGQAAYAAGEIPDAEQAIERALANKPGPTEAARAKQFLEFLRAAQEPQKAVQARAGAEQLLKTDPDCLPALYTMAVAATKLGQFNEAKGILEDRILKRFSDFSPAWRDLTFLYANALADDRKAQEVGEKARQLLPNDTALASLLGKIAYRQHDYKRTVELLAEATRSPAVDPELLYELGMAYNQLKQTNQTRQAFEKALQLKLDTTKAQEVRRILAQLH